MFSYRIIAFLLKIAGVLVFFAILGGSISRNFDSTSAQTPSVNCQNKTQLFTVGGHAVFKWNGLATIFYKSGMTIDADGAPKAYHPKPNDNEGLDHLANAGSPGNWFALVTDNGKPSGNPVIQKAGDPAPGFFISMTALEDTTKQRTDPRRYVDSSQIPYIVLPSNHSAGAKLGDFAVVFNGKNGTIVNAIYADIGPTNKIGEGSIALADALGILSSPKTGGTAKEIVYVVFPGSGNLKPRSLVEINTEAQKHFRDWGGIARLKACFQ
jgi:Fungal chitosanase of glycosyl hydrolase group 75